MAQVKISDLTAATSVADGDEFELESGGAANKATAAQIAKGARVQDKMDATTAPGATDDSAAGYAVGSKWVDVTGDKAYMCVDATAATAVWKELSAPAHAASHTDGSDDIQDATAGQKGLATAAQITKLDGIATGAEVNPDLIAQAEAEAGTATTERIFNALRVKQAIDALAPAGSLPVADTTAVVKGSADATKLVRIEADGIATATTRVITMPDQDVDLTPNTGAFPAAAHAARHTDGSDDIQDATAGQKGLATAAQITKLDGIETAATADQSDAEIKTAYEANANTNEFSDAEQTKLAGVATGAIANVVEDTTPQWGGNVGMNAKALTEEFTAGAALVDGDLCYLKSDGKFWKADADAAATADGMLAMCTETISADATGTFIVFGQYTTTGLTAGSTYYVSTTLGGITATAPSATGDIVRIVGHALSTTVLFFSPDQTYIEIA